MTVLSGLLIGAAVLVLFGRPGAGRLDGVLRSGSGVVSGAGGVGAVASPIERVRDPVRGLAAAPAFGPAAACALAGGALALLLASWTGLLLGAAVAVGGPRVLGRLEPRAVREERERLLADTPLMLDLLASCLAGGAAPEAAARAVAASVPGPAGHRLSAVAAALAVGSPPPDAWAALSGRDRADALAPAARALARAAEGGAPVAATVSRLAGDARAEARSRGEQAARRVGVLAVAPLGLCFLPAFVLLGVVPVVIGLATPLLASF